MPVNYGKESMQESRDGAEVISHLIETARTLIETDAKQSEEFFEKALNLSRNAQFINGSGECLMELGKLNYRNGNVRQSVSFLHEAVVLFEKTDDHPKACECSRLLSDISVEIGNYQEALESQLRALHFAKNIHDDHLRGSVYNKIGDIYKSLGDYHKAIENHKHSLEIFEKLKDKTQLSVTNFHIGNCYNWADELELAYQYLDKSLELAETVNDPVLLVKPTGSLAILLTKMKEYDKAMEYFYQSIDHVNLTGNLLLKADILKSLGNLYIETGNYSEAINILKESLAIAENINIKYPKNLIHRFLSEAYEKSGDIENALKHHKQYVELSGEIMNEEVALKTKGIQLRFDLEETRKEKEIAEKAVMLKDQFIANISHEIRTPLNGVLGMANLLADTNPSPEQLEYINTIKLSANNLIVIVNDILDYSKIHSGAIKFDSNEFSVRELVTGIAQLLKVKTDEKNISLNINLQSQVPDILIGDAFRLTQILTNILNNAVKFTDKGSVTFEMQLVEAKDLAVKILFTITDTGIGISEDKLQHIFESFTQVNPDKNRVFGGTGLGLAIVKQLVELQGGTVSVNSTPGSGSVFKIELPFRIPKPIVKSGSRAGRNDIALKDLSKVNVLLVEDNKVNQFLAQKILTKMGFRVQIANNGQEAIDTLKKQKFQVILMDVQMPGMNGYELTQMIRTTLPPPASQIPIIALTAYASNHEKEKALNIGMSDYITKPYSPHELLSAILKQVNIKDGKPEKNRSMPAEDSVNEDDIKVSSEKLIQLFSGSIEDVLSLLHMLVGQIPQLLQEAGVHIADKNWPATFQSVHKVKSSVNLLKINRLKNLVSELEELSRDQIHTDRISAVFEEFSRACEQTVSLLKDEIIRLKKL